MKRTDLEHIIRAAGNITDCRKLVIIGSQAILGSFPHAPAELTVSQEADTYPLESPEKADLIDGSIGEKSPFHDTFGYYAHGVSPETAVLPGSWQTRLVTVQNENTQGITGLCLNPVDLAVSKLAAGREKDLAFVTAMLQHRMVTAEEIEAVLPELKEPQIPLVRARLKSCRSREASDTGAQPPVVLKGMFRAHLDLHLHAHRMLNE